MTAPSSVSPQPLMARFDQRSGEMMVYGGGFFGLFVLSVAIGRGDIALGIISLLLFAVAYHFWPFVQRNHPAVVASSAGLMITGLGTVAWDAIVNASNVDKAVRTIRNTELHLTLARPLDKALVEEDMGGLKRRLMVQIWRYKKDTLVIRLEPLDTAPEPILEAVQAFLNQRAA
jgi:hypothetical protein